MSQLSQLTLDRKVELVISIVVACATAVYAFVALRTLCTLNEQTQATQSAANAAIESNRLASLRARKELRAYALVTVVEGGFSEAGLFRITLGVNNEGRTPGQNAEWVAECAYVGNFERDVSRKPFVDCPPAGTDLDIGTIPPGHAVGIKRPDCPDIPEHELNDPQIPMRMYVEGCLFYDDAFGERHGTEFCFTYHPERRSLSFCPDHNYAD